MAKHPRRKYRNADERRIAKRSVANKLTDDNSEMFHSRFLMNLKKISSTGSTKPVSTTPSTRTAPFTTVAHVVVVGRGQSQVQHCRAGRSR
jgi:hypothetical protein